MNTVVWIVQILLALAFLAAGAMKLSQPKEKILASQGERMGWMNDFSQNAIRGIGLAEVLGAIGVVGPWALNVAPKLTPIAALGLVLLMAGAAATHLRRKETPAIVPNVVLALLAAFVAWQRF